MRVMRRSRRLLLLASSALLTPMVVQPARAQAPDARPQGGRVVAGQASIAQTPSRTTVTQGSDRAVIEWRGFDIGANHGVQITQPGAGSWSLQRVTGGDPSAIAGRLTSNGGVAIVNPAGVVFHQGAQVDVAGLIATASDTANQAFMAGRMAFDGAPRPGARVENHGTVTVRDQGLAALVGPAAANAGTIRARLGRVAIAGAEAFTIDLAGDGLLAFDVTRQVATAPAGAAALATNTGTIAAEGGHVLLTARAASGLLETLVQAGGSIVAAGITAHAPGGGVLVPAGAVLDASAASGAHGGAGQVTVGAGARSRPGAPDGLSARTTVQRGATLRADAAAGPGGRVIVHAAGRTEMRGAISARGTPGGAVEVSSRGGMLVDGTLDAGATGQVLLDPEALHIVQNPGAGADPREVAASTVNSATGHLTLTAERRIRVLAAVNRSAGPLTLATTNAAALPGDGISVERPLSVTGDLALRSAGDITQAAAGARISAGTIFAESRAGAVRLEATDNAIRALAGGGAATRFDLATSLALPVDGAVSAGAMRITSARGLMLHAPLAATGTMELVGLRGIAQDATGAGVSAATLLLESASGAIALGGAGNRVTELGDVSAPFGLELRNAAALNVAGVLNGAGAAVSLAVDAGDLTQDPSVSRIRAGSLAVAAPAGAVRFDGPLNTVARLSGTARDEIVLDAGGPLTIDGRVAAPRVALTAFGDLDQRTGALVETPWLEAQAIGGSVLLQDPLNAVTGLGPSGAGIGFALATAGSLTLAGRLTAPEASLIRPAACWRAPARSTSARCAPPP
jgi:filamentous hemagglutinin family protein